MIRRIIHGSKRSETESIGLRYTDQSMLSSPNEMRARSKQIDALLGADSAALGKSRELEILVTGLPHTGTSALLEAMRMYAMNATLEYVFLVHYIADGG